MRDPVRSDAIRGDPNLMAKLPEIALNGIVITGSSSTIKSLFFRSFLFRSIVLCILPDVLDIVGANCSSCLAQREPPSPLLRASQKSGFQASHSLKKKSSVSRRTKALHHNPKVFFTMDSRSSRSIESVSLRARNSVSVSP